jgi:hypothetical protein
MMGSRRHTMEPVHILRRFFAVAALLAIGLAPGAASADLEPWNQEEVTEVAKALHTGVKELRQSLRRESTGDITTKAKARMRMLEILKVLEKSCGQLVRRLEAGDGREKTLNIAKKIRSLVRDAETEAKKFMTTQQTDERVAPVEEALDGLAPYYFEPEPQEPAEG